MSSNENSLLLKIKGDSTGATKAAADTRAAIASLRTSSVTHFSAIQAATKAPLTGFQNLTNITQVLGASTAALQGPLGGVAGRLGSIGTLAREAGTGIGATGAAVGALVVVAGAAVVGLVALGNAIFDLAKSTADYAGKLFDLSQQTNFTVETLSALSLAAKTSGGSIDTVSSALGIFQANMVKAAEGNKEAAKTFRDLKIDTTNQETALRQAMSALFAMGETEKQSAEAKKLFGKAAKDVLGIIKETSGDLDVATAKYQKMNLIVSTEAAAAADAFSDSLDLLNEQLAGVGRTIGFAVIPVLNVFFQDMSSGLSGSQGEWVTWGGIIRAEVAGVLGMLQALAQFARNPGILAAAQLPGQVMINQRSLLDRAQGESAALSVAAIAARVARGSRGTGGGGSGSGGGGGKAARDTAFQDAKAEAALVEREALKATEFDIMENKRSLDGQLKDIQEFTRRAIELADEKQDAAIVRINSEQEALEKAFAKKLITQKEFKLQGRELTLRNDKAERERNDEVNELEHERDLKVSAAEVAAKKRSLQIAEEADERQIKRIDNRIRDQVLKESEGEQQIAAIVDEGFKRRRDALTEELTHYSTTLEKREDINAEIIRLDGDRAFSAEEAARRIIKAQFDEQNAAAEGATRKRRSTDPDVDPKAPTGAIDQLFYAIENNLTGTTQTAAMAGLQAMQEVFAGLGQAVGQAVHAFVLYGKAGASVRQVTAQILASVAQMAAVKAIFELAEGFAALALAFFGIPNAGLSANAHFIAAATYGAIAGAAALMGRSAASTSFSQASGGSGGGAGGSTTSGASSRSEPKVADYDRRNLSPQVVEIRFAAGFDDVLEAKIIKNVEHNGKLRDVIGNK